LKLSPSGGDCIRKDDVNVRVRAALDAPTAAAHPTPEGQVIGGVVRLA
jgi:hypothetical protein